MNRFDLPGPLIIVTTQNCEQCELLLLNYSERNYDL